jgi:hypothetical protein
MAIFIANENGDWWEYQPGQVLYVLNTDDLDDHATDDIANNWGHIDGSDDYPDKLEKAIWKHGHVLHLDEEDLRR